MYKLRIAFLGVLFLVLGCAEKITRERLQLLTGYWEITKVTFPNGEEKNYTVNPTVDYFYWDGTKGYRKKVYPKFDGSYDTSNDAEPYVIIEKEDGFVLSYDNSLSTWTERLVKLTDDSITLKNKDELLYTYTRYEPIEIYPDGEKK